MSRRDEFLWAARDSDERVVETSPTMAGLLAVLGLPAKAVRHPTPTSAEVEHPEYGRLEIVPWYPKGRPASCDGTGRKVKIAVGNAIVPRSVICPACGRRLRATTSPIREGRTWLHRVPPHVRRASDDR